MERKDLLTAEHQALKLQTEQLAREHRELESNGGNHAAHVAHRARLRRKIAELRAHRARLESDRLASEHQSND